jgi:hypothetical protein
MTASSTPMLQLANLTSGQIAVAACSNFRHCLMANVVVGTGVHGYVGGAIANESNESNEITDRR